MFVYQFLIRLLAPLIVLLIILDAIKRKGGRDFILQRLGLHFPSLPARPERIWIHCASVGEVKAAEPLIRQLLSEHDLLITTGTPAGKTVLDDLFGNRVEHRYCPLDWPFAVRRFLNTCRPSRLWVMETEIWPNLYRMAHQRGIPVEILNARISFKTLRAPQWLRNAYRQTLSHVSRILARSEAEAERFTALGADPACIDVLGNLKYALTQSPPHHPRPIQRDYVLVASTHADEELEIARLWQTLKRSELLVIVPRHPARSESIQKQLQTLSLNLRVASLGEQADTDTDCFLDDRLGKLMPLFEHAKLVVMGGSFAPKGGHNLLEPAAYGIPILTGPDMRDFEEETALLLEHGGLIQCADYTDLKTQMQGLLTAPDEAAQLGLNAHDALTLQQNVLVNYLKTLKVAT